MTGLEPITQSVIGLQAENLFRGRKTADGGKFETRCTSMRLPQISAYGIDGELGSRFDSVDNAGA
jgi:hypothetical protein